MFGRRETPDFLSVTNRIRHSLSELEGKHRWLMLRDQRDEEKRFQGLITFMTNVGGPVEIRFVLSETSKEGLTNTYSG